MISKEEIKRVAALKNLNLGQAEKFAFQDMILFLIYRKHSEIVFKGGTALAKCYGFDRFSEDLDFNGNDTQIIETIKKGLKNYNVQFDVKSKKGTTKFLIQGPLYQTGIDSSLCSIKIDINYREKLFLETNLLKIRPVFSLIPMFDTVVMSKQEIFAEKIRTVFTRDQARDLYDLYYLDNVLVDIELINKKLDLYSIKFSKYEFLKAIDKMKNIWDPEMKYLVKNYPSFEDVKNKILGYF